MHCIGIKTAYSDILRALNERRSVICRFYALMSNRIEVIRFMVYYKGINTDGGKNYAR